MAQNGSVCTLHNTELTWLGLHGGNKAYQDKLYVFTSATGQIDRSIISMLGLLLPGL